MMMKAIFFSFALIFAFNLSSCVSTSVKISEENQSLGEIKRAFSAIMGEPRHVSQNQREFTSQYFGRNADAKFDPNKVKERLFAKFVILGDRRPYDIEITVVVEEKTGRSYKKIGTDPTMAKTIAKELEERLNQSREGRNIIDDFRAF